MKLKAILISIFLFFSFAPFLFGQSVDDIRILTEHYPPYNFTYNGELQGIAVELMELILGRLGSSQNVDDIALVPWARGYSRVLTEENTCLFSMTRTESREGKFKWVGPICKTSVSIIKRKDSNIVIDEFDDLNSYSIGAVIDDVGEQLLIERGIDSDSLISIGGTHVIYQYIQMLNLGRIDMFAYEVNAIKWELNSNFIDPDDFETVYTLLEGDLYYAFNINTSDYLIRRFQKALDELKDEVIYQDLLEKYIHSDPGM